ncbi:Ppx/GppA phosphatase family protein [Microterricola pindariensis]|uniref:Exopolyphosphatase n=1 Tax=Microterricola pindariensis TaxID=478010 RepID=A0ABX5AS40_9MICO|nr:Ppx/GppA phosphatase family protein [Microterricola pindariensis]PPL15019.1 exopolyphosphatase [Microterricola pindariensis]
MTRVAAIDCGTNSIRLLIADLDGHGGLTDVLRTLEVVRLGQGVDRTGRFADDALARTLDATRRYAELCREHGVERARFVATSATRDAANRDEFTDAVQQILGVPAEVIPGTEEAALSFRGALTAVAGAGADAAARHLVIDLGGGSTELVLGRQAPEAAISMDIGCVRMTERHLGAGADGDVARDDAAFAALRADVNAALDAASATVDVSLATEVVGVAGTVTTITAHALRLDAYRPELINGSRLPLAVVLEACESLARMPRAERAALPFMHPGRVDVIVAGAVIWSTVLQRIAEATTAAGHPLEFVTTSEHDILDGVALSLG